MATRAPGKAFRDGLSLVDLIRMFPDDDAARTWFEAARWGGRPFCPYCGSENVQSNIAHKTQTHRCREKECAKRFTVRVGTAMERSHLGYQTWALAIYLLTTSLKGVSSMKLHRDLKITQKSAWFLAHRIREWFASESAGFAGPVEVDETYFGGKDRNKHALQRSGVRGPSGKTAVVGMKDRESNEVRAQVVERTDAETLQDFVVDHAEAFATVYTDEAKAYQSLPYRHESVKHSAGEYVNGQAHTNGVESFWATMKRAHKGIYHKFSPKHLDRYVREFAGRHNLRCDDTLTQMRIIVLGLEGKRLTYRQLKADNGLAAGAR